MTGLSCAVCGTAFAHGASSAGLCPSCLLKSALSIGQDSDGVDEPSTTLLAGTEVGPFVILRLLGRGGMAAVYEARDVRLGRTIALKVLPQEFLYDDTFARRFEHEARVIASLEHGHIVPIYASGIDRGIPWMSMRLLAGGNLGDRLAQHRPDPREAVRMLRSVADALDYAHAHGVVHRDIKPTNLLLDSSDAVYIGDFGLAQILEGGRGGTTTGMLAGTPHYIAPERALDAPADHRCDIYSLGIVAYEMFVGKLPFAGNSPVAVLLKHVNEPLPFPPEGLVPRALGEALQKATAKDPAERWPTAGAFVSSLEVALGMTPAHGEALTARAHDKRGRFSVAWIGAGRGKINRRAFFRGLASLGMLTSPRSERPWTVWHLVWMSAVIGLTWWLARGPAQQPESRPPVAVEQPSKGAPPIVTAAPAAQPKPQPPADLRSRASARPPSAVPPSPSAPAAPDTGQQTAPVSIDATSAPSAPSVELPAPPASPPPPLASSADIPASTNRSSAPIASAPVAPDVPDVMPIQVRKVEPDFPTAAILLELEGDVQLQFVVGEDGTVRDVTVLKSVHKLLDDAAREAVLQYKYEPGQRNGVPARFPIRVTVMFRLP